MFNWKCVIRLGLLGCLFVGCQAADPPEAACLPQAPCLCDGSLEERACSLANGCDCAAPCVPDCADRVCGDDGCGTPCGTCAEGVCSAAGQCVDAPPACGDGVCADAEDCATCPADCGACCGDGQCAADESCATCPADCVCAAGLVCDLTARSCVGPPDAPDAEVGPDATTDAGIVDSGVDANVDRDQSVALDAALEVDAAIDPDAAVEPDAAIDPDAAVEPDAAIEPMPTGPRILLLSADTRRLSEGQQVTISAVVTDPDGIEDLIGGALETAQGDALGAFATADQEGAYSRTVTWDALHRVRPIRFGAGDEQRRVLTAVFFDAAGNQTRQTIELTLHCDGATACDGECAELATDADHCGACGVVCPSLEVQAACVAGQCGEPCANPERRHACEGECISVVGDAYNCGGCQVACAGDLGERPSCADVACQVSAFDYVEVNRNATYRIDIPPGGGAWMMLRPRQQTQIRMFQSAGRSLGYQMWRVTPQGPWAEVRSCWNGTCRVTLGVGAGTYYIRWHGFGGDASPDRGIRTEINPPIEPEQAPADLQAAGIFNQPPLAAEGAAELSLRWPVDANLTLTTTGVDGGECPGDTILAVLQAGEVVAMNDDTNGLCSQVELPVQAGVEYTVRVTAFRQVALPAYALEVR